MVFMSLLAATHAISLDGIILLKALFCTAAALAVVIGWESRNNVGAAVLWIGVGFFLMAIGLGLS